MSDASHVTGTSTNYLAQYDAATAAQKFALVRRWIDDEPIGFFRELRNTRPVFVTPLCTLVTRLNDVIDVLNQPKVFTVELYGPKMKDYLMTHDDDAVHTREKAIMQGFLNREDLPRVRDLVAYISRGILDAAQGRIEAVNGYCRMVPARLVQEYFGLDGGDPKDLIEWSYWSQYDSFHNYPWDLITEEERRHIVKRHDEVDEQLATFVKHLIIRKFVPAKLENVEDIALAPVRLIEKLVHEEHNDPSFKDDIVTRMLRTSYPSDVRFDMERVGLNIGGLLVGAVETTSQAVAQTTEFLLNRADLFTRALEAARQPDPTEFDGFVWEAMRFVSPFPFTPRTTAQDYVLAKGKPHETPIRAGTVVLAVTQSAMFDPAAFEHPEEFQPGRNWYRYFHFGYGSHECLGKFVGMVMIPEMVRQIVLRPGIKAQGAIDRKSGPLPEQYELSWSAT